MRDIAEAKMLSIILEGIGYLHDNGAQPIKCRESSVTPFPGINIRVNLVAHNGSVIRTEPIAQLMGE
jgi:hypothetical protein